MSLCGDLLTAIVLSQECDDFSVLMTFPVGHANGGLKYGKGLNEMRVSYSRKHLEDIFFSAIR